MDRFFDSISFPQKCFEYRSFDDQLAAQKNDSSLLIKEVREQMDEQIIEEQQGKRATFVIQVMFRQNATWQGTINWTEEKKTQKFRSALEMLKLMEEALAAQNQQETLQIEWQ